MSLTLHYHPLASFCWKVLIALYENGLAFTPKIVDLGDPASRAEFAALWPMERMPVLVDDGRQRVVPETSTIIEYLARHHPGPIWLVPEEPDRAGAIRFLDRFYDHYVQEPMQKIVTDRIRPEGRHDPFGVEQARGVLAKACRMVDADMVGKRWAMGDDFTMADCAAAPALFYANEVMPLAESHPVAFGYLGRLSKRPSMARVLAEAEPYFRLFPRA